MTRWLRFDEDPEAAIIAACECLAAGDVVALPTETVYGLAADATNPTAVAKIFAAKERPFFDPLIVHLHRFDALDAVAAIPTDLRLIVAQLTSAFWPGPLTLLLPRTPLIPDLVTAGLPDVAVRASAHPVFQAVAARFGRPLAAPSANRFGRISPTTAEHVAEELAGRIPLIIDGGSTQHGVESTIILPTLEGIQILRPGPIAPESFHFTQILPCQPQLSERPTAPGNVTSHYAPRTPLLLAEIARAVPGKRCGILAWQGAYAAEFAEVEWLSRSHDLLEAAANLFAAMRRLDAAGLDLIVAELVPRQGVGLAILDRLTRASAV